jgi:hypothetical protein
MGFAKGYQVAKEDSGAVVRSRIIGGTGQDGTRAFRAGDGLVIEPGAEVDETLGERSGRTMSVLVNYGCVSS